MYVDCYSQQPALNRHPVRRQNFRGGRPRFNLLPVLHSNMAGQTPSGTPCQWPSRGHPKANQRNGRQRSNQRAPQRGRYDRQAVTRNEQLSRVRPISVLLAFIEFSPSDESSLKQDEPKTTTTPQKGGMIKHAKNSRPCWILGTGRSISRSKRTACCSKKHRQ